MNTRDTILARARHQPPPARPLPELPAFAKPSSPRAGSLADFAAALQRMGGKLVEVSDLPEPPDLPALPEGSGAAAVVRRLFPDASIICSATAEVPGNRSLADVEHPSQLEDVTVGVVRASLGVAETGSVLLTERELGVEALGFLAQHLVVLLDPGRIVATLHDAYLDAAFNEARYTILMTGPSATADIEGVLIHGAQGIRSLTVVPVAG